MPTILDKIVDRKRIEIQAAMAQVSEAELIRAVRDVPAALDFYAAIANHNQVRLIAEVKKASPSKGVIRADFEPVAIAKCYADNGAAAISVLTDVDFFQGSLDYLRSIRREVSIPLLRKDFILCKYQILEARAAGADAILLIAECLDQSTLQSLYDYARELGMHVLMELYEPSNLDRVLATGCPIVGINNRDLRTFEVDLHHTTRLAEKIGDDRCVVSESGIYSSDDVRMLRENSIDAILVGESLMRQVDIAAAVRQLIGEQFQR